MKWKLHCSVKNGNKVPKIETIYDNDEEYITKEHAT